MKPTPSWLIFYVKPQDRTYQKAIEVLNLKRRPQRPNIKPIKDIPGLTNAQSKNESDFKGTPSILGMKEWLSELGHSMTAINNLNVIHVAGTKGKGSTCAFTDSLLRAHSNRTGVPSKVGLYTSPHLIFPEERIRINFEPLSRDLFAKYVFEVDDILTIGNQRQIDLRPRYLQFFALLAFHTFIREGIDAAIIEAHHGGEYDSTNFVSKPCVTAITTLGLDHVKQLGSTIDSIAWHKGGIFKSGAIAISAKQKTAAIKVLNDRAAAKGNRLRIPDVGENIPAESLHALQLKPDVQLTNCTVAIAAAEAYLERRSAIEGSKYGLTSSDISQGIQNFSWLGRFQIVDKGQTQWYLDSAHNELSVGVAAKWFIEASEMKRDKLTTCPRILIFSMVTIARDVIDVIRRLATALRGTPIQNVIITSYVRDSHSAVDGIGSGFTMARSEESYNTFCNVWNEIYPDLVVAYEPYIDEALELAKKIGKNNASTQIFVTGSQNLVGSALSLLQETSIGHEILASPAHLIPEMD